MSQRKPSSRTKWGNLPFLPSSFTGTPFRTILPISALEIGSHAGDLKKKVLLFSCVSP